jgi:Kef-type K+ transport system membrane component KefB
MHLDFGLVRRKARSAAKISVVGLVAPLLLGVACGATLARWLLDDIEQPSLFAFFLGVALCLSAIPVIAKTMFDLGMLHRDAGQLALTAGMIDDAVGWLLLSLVASLAVSGADLDHAVLAVTTLVAFLAAALVIGRPLSHGVVRVLARSNDDGVTVAGVVVVMLLTAAATQALGLEAILGAFVAGALLGSAGGELAPRLGTLRLFVTAILAPVFFATAGLRVDLTLLTQPVVLGATVLVLAVATLGKFGGVYVAARHSGLVPWEACAVGAAMNARGVVDIIVAMVGLRLGVLTVSTYTIVVVVAIATSLMAPPILRCAMRHIEPTDEESERANRLGTSGDVRFGPLAPVPGR